MYVGYDWGKCHKCGTLTPHTTTLQEGGGFLSTHVCSRCQPTVALAELSRENQELKQRVLRLEERIAELMVGAT